MLEGIKLCKSGLIRIDIKLYIYIYIIQLLYFCSVIHYTLLLPRANQHHSGRRGAVVKGIEHISTIVLVRVWICRLGFEFESTSQKR